MRSELPPCIKAVPLFERTNPLLYEEVYAIADGSYFHVGTLMRLLLSFVLFSWALFPAQGQTTAAPGSNALIRKIQDELAGSVPSVAGPSIPVDSGCHA